MIEVKSSNLSHVGYNPLTKTLTVRFKKGGTYDYHEVPPEIFQALMNAESIGSFFSKFVKNAFKFTKAEEVAK